MPVAGMQPNITHAARERRHAVLGVPPGGEEIARSLAFLLAALFYCGVWLSLAMLLSIVLRSPATAALVALGIWLSLTVLGRCWRPRSPK